MAPPTDSPAALFRSRARALRGRRSDRRPAQSPANRLDGRIRLIATFSHRLLHRDRLLPADEALVVQPCDHLHARHPPRDAGLLERRELYIECWSGAGHDLMEPALLEEHACEATSEVLLWRLGP